MDVIRSSKTSADFQETTQCYTSMTEEITLHNIHTYFITLIKLIWLIKRVYMEYMGTVSVVQ
jgi:hypothetical protein